MLRIPDIDKQAHFWAGMGLCLAFSLMFGTLAGVSLALFAGALRELLGNMDGKDFFATAIGAVVGAFFFGVFA